jgi:hypothetical protein
MIYKEQSVELFVAECLVEVNTHYHHVALALTFDQLRKYGQHAVRALAASLLALALLSGLQLLVPALMIELLYISRLWFTCVLCMQSTCGCGTHCYFKCQCTPLLPLVEQLLAQEAVYCDVLAAAVAYCLSLLVQFD